MRRGAKLNKKLSFAALLLLAALILSGCFADYYTFYDESMTPVGSYDESTQHYAAAPASGYVRIRTYCSNEVDVSSVQYNEEYPLIILDSSDQPVYTFTSQDMISFEASNHIAANTNYYYEMVLRYRNLTPGETYHFKDGFMLTGKDTNQGSSPSPHQVYVEGFGFTVGSAAAEPLVPQVNVPAHRLPGYTETIEPEEVPEGDVIEAEPVEGDVAEGTENAELNE